MKRAKAILPMLVLGLLIAITLARSKNRADVKWSDTLLLMDTVVEIQLWADSDFGFQEASDSLLKKLVSLEDLLDQGRFVVSKSNQANIPDEVKKLIALSDSAYRLSRGFFDPTIGAVTRLWDFSDGATPPHPDSVRNALRLVGMDRFVSGQISDSVVLDFGGIAKGYAADCSVDLLGRLGCTRAMINIGGDLSILGSHKDGRPWHIAIRHPRKPDCFIGYLDVGQCAIATSGDYERYFFHQGKRYHHIIDPRDGMPGSRCQSVTVVANSAWLADAMATALFLMGPHEGSQFVECLDGIEAVFVYAEGESVLVTDGLRGRFTKIDNQ